VCLERRNPVCVITKGALVRRDVDVLALLARRAEAEVSITIPFLDETVARKVEPGAPTPAKRFETMRALADAGIRVGIGIAPLVPGLNESDVPELLKRAKESGASSAFMTLLRLPREVLPVFQERIAQAFPDRAKHIESAILDVRGGRWNDARFGARMRGSGARWEAVERLFEIHCRRCGLTGSRPPAASIESSPATRQGTLFP